MPCSRPKEPVEIGRQTTGTLSLAQYLDLLAGVPLPTQQQKENFVEYVSHAHSWYKHLPLYPPGEPFYLFMDKYAGCDRVLLSDGKAALVGRSQQGFHYSDIPTEQYRNQFGHLGFSCGAGTTVALLGRGPLVEPRDKVPAVPGNDALMYHLPAEILEAGAVELTAVIHTGSAAHNYWDGRGRIKPDELEWPEESGGRAALEKIFDRCRKMREPGFSLELTKVEEAFFKSHPYSAGHLMGADPILHELLAPEQRRQQTEIVKAIDRICEVIRKHRAAQLA